MVRLIIAGVLCALVSSCTSCGDFNKIGQACTRSYAGVSKQNLSGDCGGILICAVDTTCRGECKGHCKKACNGLDGCPFACTCTFTLADENGGTSACGGDGC